MNEFEKLCRLIEARAHGAVVDVDASSSRTGSWWGDVSWLGNRAVVEWRPGNGFGVSTAAGAYGEGPDVVVETIDEALQQVMKLIGSAPQRPKPRKKISKTAKKKHLFLRARKQTKKRA